MDLPSIDRIIRPPRGWQLKANTLQRCLETRLQVVYGFLCNLEFLSRSMECMASVTHSAVCRARPHGECILHTGEECVRGQSCTDTVAIVLRWLTTHFLSLTSPDARSALLKGSTFGEAVLLDTPTFTACSLLKGICSVSIAQRSLQRRSEKCHGDTPEGQHLVQRGFVKWASVKPEGDLRLSALLKDNVAGIKLPSLWFKDNLISSLSHSHPIVPHRGRQQAGMPIASLRPPLRGADVTALLPGSRNRGAEELRVATPGLSLEGHVHEHSFPLTKLQRAMPGAMHSGRPCTLDGHALWTAMHSGRPCTLDGRAL
ncbi:hypothetical protein EYF80_041442 [Liparis tanakae]|uniref:Uncharacterized protein n=1 Tax=Liparis tanakae TaxID=230148 RepID=A0A4Z2G665_9TELE|nr:hypothetical protein EYF80_041442 [Liparis tanakae]